MDISRLLLPLHSCLYRGHSCGNKGRRRDGGSRDRKRNNIIDGQRPRTSNESAYRADIQGLSEFEELFAIGVFPPDEEGHLKVNALKAPAFVVSWCHAQFVMGDVFPKAHWYPSFSTEIDRNLYATR